MLMTHSISHLQSYMLFISVRYRHTSVDRKIDNKKIISIKGTIHLCFETFYLLRADKNKTGVADGDGYADQMTEK